jgi:hypothetical protein
MDIPTSFESIFFCLTKLKIMATSVPYLRRQVAGFSPLRPGFPPGSVHVGFVVDKEALGLFSEFFGISC